MSSTPTSATAGGPVAVGRLALAAACAALACLALGARAYASTHAAIGASLTPDRLRAHATLGFDVELSGGEAGVPSPVREAVIRLPAGFGLDVPALSSCPANRLRARGIGACPARSAIGAGHAIVEALTGSLRTTEDVALTIFVGEPHNLEPTFEIYGRGYTPLDERLIFPGRVTPGTAPFGEQLVLSLPPISTLALEPDASVVSLALRIGQAPRGPGHPVTSVLTPSRCPPGGFAFAAELTYAEGPSSTARYALPCPAGGPPASPQRGSHA
ncbi:MAG TPA: hypothetical protein VGY13_00680 [Solirubrobacteraceae bacterium]|jgi:hypothetical protein|nr:hypothetical protein [Solirubrobacteraceae bacterium]